MVHIEGRKLTTGETNSDAPVLAIVDGRRNKKSATFDRRSDAVKWSQNNERQIGVHENTDIFSLAQKPKTVADAIDCFMKGMRNTLKDAKR